MAEGVGFEPTRACALPVFKRGCRTLSQFASLCQQASGYPVKGQIRHGLGKGRGKLRLPRARPVHRLQLVLSEPELGDYFVGFSGEA